MKELKHIDIEAYNEMSAKEQCQAMTEILAEALHITPDSSPEKVFNPASNPLKRAFFSLLTDLGLSVQDKMRTIEGSKILIDATFPVVISYEDGHIVFTSQGKKRYMHLNYIVGEKVMNKTDWILSFTLSDNPDDSNARGVRFKENSIEYPPVHNPGVPGQQYIVAETPYVYGYNLFGDVKVKPNLYRLADYIALQMKYNQEPGSNTLTSGSN